MKLTLTLVFFFISFTSWTQNLVPNGSFEDFNNCPTTNTQIDELDNWFSPTMYGTPDHYHTCASQNSPFSIPNTVFGYQFPQSGEGFIGFFLDRNLTNPPVIREYIAASLTETLEKDVCYKFEMFINLGNSSTAAIDRIGVYFSDTIILNEIDVPLSFEPTIESPTGTILSDTLNWVPITGEFQANGTENYLIIGNFRPDSLLQIGILDSTATLQDAYYFLDNITLTKCNSTNVDQLDLSKNISIAPNPTSNELNIYIENKENNSPVQIQLYDFMGQLIFNSEKKGKDIYTWDIGHLPQGTYFLEIDYLGKKYIQKVMKIDL